MTQHIGSNTGSVPTLLDGVATLSYALDNDLSIARFGDGELTLAFKSRSLKGRLFHKFSRKGVLFQRYDRRLSAKLWEALVDPPDGLLLCFNNAFLRESKYYMVIDYDRTSKDYTQFLSIHKPNDVGVLERSKQQRQYHKWFRAIQKYSAVRIWGEATCFWLCAFYEEYVENRVHEVLDLYKRLFKERNVLIVCPRTPLLGPSFQYLVRNRIIKTPKSIQFLEIPNRDCFEYYNRIVREILRHKNLNAVFVQAGPTATVLVAELTKQHGLLSYDVGSLNVSLERAANVHNLYF